LRKELPWIGQSPELISGIHHRAIGRARLLLDFYVHHQTDVSGKVYYGKALTYKWISKRIVECPSARTLERYNAKLRENGYIVTKTVIHEGAAVGFTVRLRNQAKFRTAPEARPATQIGLFNAPLPMPRAAAEHAPERAVEIPVEKRQIAAGGVPTNLSGGLVRVVGVKTLKKETGAEQTDYPPRLRAETANASAKPQTNPEGAWRQQQKARRILREIEVLRECYVGAYGDDLARRDFKLGLLYDELAKTGWQNARAG